MHGDLRHRGLVLAAALLFSTGGAAIKACSLSIGQVACFRSALAAAALWIALPAWRSRPRGPTLAVGAAYAATMLLFVAGNKLTTAANTIFLQATAPVYLLLLGPLVLGERTRREDWTFTAVVGVGMLLFFVGGEPPQRTAPDPLAGNLLAAASGLSWALCLLGLRWLGRRAEAGGPDLGGAAVVAGNVLAALAALPFALPVRAVSALDAGSVAYLGLVQIALAYFCLTRGVRRIPALEASLLLLLEPVLNAFWTFAVHGERPGPWSLAGCGVILAATVARTLGSGRRRA